MQIDRNKITFILFVWYAWIRVKLKLMWEHIIYWMGLYLPLFIINMFVRGSMQKIIVEDANFIKHELKFFRIEYQIPYRSGTVDTKLQYDITSRVLWLLHFVGDNSTDLYDYSVRAIPWGDIHVHRLHKHGEAEIVFNYHVSQFDSKDLLKPLYDVCLRVDFAERYYFTTYEQLKNSSSPITYNIQFNTLNFLEPEADSDSE